MKRLPIANRVSDNRRCSFAVKPNARRGRHDNKPRHTAFPTTIAGSLPKPSWLAAPNKLWAPWRLEGDELAAGKDDATLLALKLQEDAGIDIVCDGEQARQHFVHGFLEAIEGIDFERRVEIGIRNDRYKAMCPTVVGELRLRSRVHAREARLARAHTTRKLKFTLPGPMTIVDTIADAHYGDRVKMAMAFAGLLNEEARGLAADGVDVIQFDEPAFNVYMDAAAGWGIEALHRAIDGVAATTAVHICYGYGIPANVEWKATLGGEWRQYEKFFPALAKSRIDQVSLECIHSHVPMSVLKLLEGKDVLLGVIDVATDTIETPEEVAAVITQAADFVPKKRSSPAPIAAWRRCAATLPRESSKRWRRARRWRAPACAERPLNLPIAARENVDQFADLAPLLAFVAGRNRVLDAMGDMIGEDLLFGTPQSGTHRR